MSDDIKNDIILDGSSASWEINLDGDIEGTYRGTFKFRCYLTPTQKLAAGRAYRELLGVNPTFATEHEAFIAYALTQLKFRVIAAPPFWTSTSQDSIYSGDIPDENIITAILDAAISSEAKYREVMKEKRLNSVKNSKEVVEKMLSDLENPQE